jgi:hypothetical protein
LLFFQCSSSISSISSAPCVAVPFSFFSLFFCFSFFSPSLFQNKLTSEIARKVLGLVQDPFGNYVVQHVLQKFPKDEQTTKLIRALHGNVCELCTGKFSSNVIEKVSASVSMKS